MIPFQHRAAARGLDAVAGLPAVTSDGFILPGRGATLFPSAAAPHLPHEQELLAAIRPWRIHEAMHCSCRTVPSGLEGCRMPACHVNGTSEFAQQAKRYDRMRREAWVAREMRRGA